MDKKTSDDAGTAFAKLSKLIEDEELVIFSPSEARALKEVAALWEQVRAVISLGVTVGGVLKWVVGFAALWAILKAGVFSWISEGLDK